MRHILTADIGGTNSRFGHFIVDAAGQLALLEAKWLNTTDAGSFVHLLGNLKDSGFSLLPETADIAVVAVAGPVEGGYRSRPPLIAWDIDLRAVREQAGFRICLLINDFVAQAFACGSKIAEDADTILSGSPVGDAAIAVIGAGTGLGKSLLLHDGKGGYRAIPSEGGHTNFPFLTEREYAYQAFLLKERGEHYITGNTVVSGRGLSYLHYFLTGRTKEPGEIVQELSLYPETLVWASRFYARACRNYVLETLALGGLYVAGGVAARAPELLRHPEFEREFRSSDTMAHLLAHLPVYLIRDQNSGLWGGAVLAAQTLRKAKDE
jgi:glucokinase